MFGYGLLRREHRLRSGLTRDQVQDLITVRAAKLAGIEIHGGNLLDEPVAAFHDYLTLHPDKVSASLTRKRTLLGFDVKPLQGRVLTLTLDILRGLQRIVQQAE